MKIMKSLLLALSLALAMPVFAAEPSKTHSGVKLAKKKDRKKSHTINVPIRKKHTKK